MATRLEVHQLDKSFGKHQVLHGVDFTVEAGHVVGLVGPNGAGKSTIMKTVLGLIPADNGAITIDGKPVSITSHQALKHVGALIEYPGIYPFLSGRQQLALFANKSHRDENVDTVVNALGMKKYINSKAKLYSLGMKQKLGIAEALVNRPQLVILDEPMNGLDPQAVKDLRDLIRDQADQGTSFLISSHILSELEKVADDVLILNQGKIVRESSMTSLTEAGGTTYLIKTQNDALARDILTKANIALKPGSEIAFVQATPDTLNQALAALINGGVAIQDVSHVQHDLESSFLDMVHAKKEG